MLHEIVFLLLISKWKADINSQGLLKVQYNHFDPKLHNESNAYTHELFKIFDYILLKNELMQRFSENI